MRAASRGAKSPASSAMDPKQGLDALDLGTLHAVGDGRGEEVGVASRGRVDVKVARTLLDDAPPAED